MKGQAPLQRLWQPITRHAPERCHGAHLFRQRPNEATKLVPSEHSSGDKVSRGSITKTGNAHARRLLTEAAWNYRFKARIGRQAQQRQEDLSEQVRTTAWKAQLRLCKRFAVLDGRGVQRNKVCVAVARELAGFIWAIAGTTTHTPPAAASN